MSLSINPSVKRAPYYIVAPRYTRFSAGVCCLHLLCHWLNRKGERAYLALYPIGETPETNSDLLTPLLTSEIIDYHYKLGISPVVVYPEVVKGNPLKADCVVRWVLNFPGLLGGDKTYDKNELIFGYSKVLADAVGENLPILHMAVVNEDIFKPDTTPRPRKGAAFYVKKYKGKVFGVPEGAIEITSGQRGSQTPDEIAEIFRSVENFYVFENTALVAEAVLCGCPVICMVNEWFEKPIAHDELGMDGIAWGNDPAEVRRARESVHKATLNYRKLAEKFFVQLERFRELSQAKASAYPYTKKIEKKFLICASVGKLSDIPLIFKKTILKTPLIYLPLRYFRRKVKIFLRRKV